MEHIDAKIVLVEEAGVHHGVRKVVIWSRIVIYSDSLVDFKRVVNLAFIEDANLEYSIIKVWQCKQHSKLVLNDFGCLDVVALEVKPKYLF